ncbi:MAG TPA: hypothetical protein VHR97_11215 [Candidatus Baltobacteraceae bacterium]|jgi:hypothetical protein|nr:hypothetical protein [Candidatus Baltobacteraceae bacterium]
MSHDEHRCFMRAREVARIEHCDIRDNEHGGLFFGGAFKYDSSGQGFGYIIDIEFVQGIMRVFGWPKSLSSCNAKACWVTHCQTDIHLVEPLLPDEGKVFDVDAWCKRANARAQVIIDAGLRETYA